MTPLTSFYPFFMHMVPGCSEPMADQALVNAADEFCRRSRALRTTESVPITAATSATITATADMELASVLGVKLDDEPLDPFNAAEQFASRVTDATEVLFYSRSGNTILLYPAVDTTGTIDALVTWTPLRSATQLDDRFLTEWFDTLLFGVIARIKGTLDQPFTDVNAATAAQAQFLLGCSNAAVQADQAGTDAPMRIRLLDIG